MSMSAIAVAAFRKLLGSKKMRMKITVEIESGIPAYDTKGVGIRELDASLDTDKEENAVRYGEQMVREAIRRHIRGLCYPLEVPEAKT
jgi:hypothetical protein